MLMSELVAAPSARKRGEGIRINRLLKLIFFFYLLMSLRSPIKHDNSLDGASELDAHASGLPAERPEKKRKKRSTLTSGIVYISRVPPGMTPQKIRHLMERWGEVGKVYAQRRDGEWASSDSDHQLVLCTLHLGRRGALRQIMV